MASNENNEYAALWRASANEGVSYAEDFTEALVTLPEWIDGALGAGNASRVDITIKINKNGKCVLIVEDYGVGIRSVNRIKKWAATETGDNNT